MFMHQKRNETVGLNWIMLHGPFIPRIKVQSAMQRELTTAECIYMWALNSAVRSSVKSLNWDEHKWLGDSN